MGERPRRGKDEGKRKKLKGERKKAGDRFRAEDCRGKKE
jgi:hypothetical protein